jgi:hypothetical protein
MKRYAHNLPRMPGVFPDYPAPVMHNAGTEREMVTMRWGIATEILDRAAREWLDRRKATRARKS